MNFYSLERPQFRWGDYGDILLHGTAARDETTGLLLLERTGNSVPPISFPGLPGTVVTDGFKSRLLTSGFTGLSFRPVSKHRIVDLDWEKWESSQDEPEVYPESGEPEDYIFALEHDVELARQMPLMWEMVPGETAHLRRIVDPEAEFGVRLSLLHESWNGDDFFRTPEALFHFVSEPAKTWLENEVGDLVGFREW